MNSLINSFMLENVLVFDSTIYVIYLHTLSNLLVQYLIKYKIYNILLNFPL